MSENRYYRIDRFHDGGLVAHLTSLSPDGTRDIVEIVWGTVPENLGRDDSLSEVWKFSLGEGVFITVTREA